MKMPAYGTKPLVGGGGATTTSQPSGTSGNLLQDIIARFGPGILGYMLGGPFGGLAGLLFGGGGGRDPYQEQVGRLEERLGQTGPTRGLSASAQEGFLASPEASGQWLSNLPTEIADAVAMSAEQNAAINAMNESRFLDWQNVMRGAYGEAMGAIGQTRGLYA